MEISKDRKRKGFILAYTLIILLVTSIMLMPMVNYLMVEKEKVNDKSEFIQMITDESNAINFYSDIKNGLEGTAFYYERNFNSIKAIVYYHMDSESYYLVMERIS